MIARPFVRPKVKVQFEGGPLDGKVTLIEDPPAAIVHTARSRLKVFDRDFLADPHAPHATIAVVGHGRGVDPSSPLIDKYVDYARSDPRLADITREEVAKGLERKLPSDQLELFLSEFVMTEERVAWRYRFSHARGDVSVYKVASSPVPLYFNDSTRSWDRLDADA